MCLRATMIIYDSLGVNCYLSLYSTFLERLERKDLKESITSERSMRREDQSAQQPSDVSFDNLNLTARRDYRLSVCTRGSATQTMVVHSLQTIRYDELRGSKVSCLRGERDSGSSRLTFENLRNLLEHSPEACITTGPRLDEVINSNYTANFIVSKECDHTAMLV